MISMVRVSSINRNIVECKVSSNALAMLSATRINRNIVECKDCCYDRSDAHLRVLIET